MLSRLAAVRLVDGLGGLTGAGPGDGVSDCLLALVLRCFLRDAGVPILGLKLALVAERKLEFATRRKGAGRARRKR